MVLCNSPSNDILCFLSGIYIFRVSSLKIPNVICGKPKKSGSKTAFFRPDFCSSLCKNTTSCGLIAIFLTLTTIRHHYHCFDIPAGEIFILHSKKCCKCYSRVIGLPHLLFTNHNNFAGRTMLSSSPLIKFPIIYFSKIFRDKKVTTSSLSCNSISIGFEDTNNVCIFISPEAPTKDLIFSGFANTK